MIIAYHGTHTSALQSILENGILSHPFKHYHPVKFYKGERGSSVYVTENPSIARQWALSEVDDPTQVTILKLEIPDGYLLKVDEDAPEAERFVGNIPPEWIKGAYSLNADGSAGPEVSLHHGHDDAWKSYRFAKDEFKESDHPRGEGGKFSKGGQTWEKGSKQIPEGSIWEESPLPKIEDKHNPQVVLGPMRTEPFDNPKLQTTHVPVDQLHVWQSGIEPEKLRPIDEANLPPITVYKINGKHIVGNGNHRAVSAWLDGREHIPAKVVDFNDPKNKKYWKRGLYPGPHTAQDEDLRTLAKAAQKRMAAQDSVLTWQSPRFEPVTWNSPRFPAPVAVDAEVRRALRIFHASVMGNRPVLAMDRAIIPSGDILAMDKATLREVDHDGHLHVGTSNISKATVNPYWGEEIPNNDQLGLDPKKKYWLLRHPDELARAVDTFNNKPILAQHVPVSAAAHRPDLVVGSTGTDAVYKHPYLRNSLVFWTKPAIDAIDSGETKELSSSYHYDPDMTPGVYEGKKYDGIMRNIRCNHVALVPEGRAGSDVVVADAQISA